MRRILSLLFLSAVSLSWGGEVFHGEMELAFGKVRQADGSYKDVKGLKIPYTAERIDAVKISPMEAYKKVYNFPLVSAGRTGSPYISNFAKGGFNRGGGPYGPDALQKCYQNDTNGGMYAILDPAEWENPSSLDDATMLPIGVNKPWKQLTMGYHWDGSNSNRIIIRWRIWTNNVDMPEGQNDFTNEVGDFGGYFTAPQAGTYKVVFGVAQAGMTSPSETVYWATQFRTDLPTGEGPFRTDYRCVYSNAAPPQVGTSLNQFWFDWDFQDGIYENTEIDMLSDGFSNMLYAVDIDSTSSTYVAYPNSVTATKGRVVSGDNLSMWYDYDNDSLKYGEPRVDRLANPVAEIEIKSRLNSSSISSLAIQTSCAGTSLDSSGTYRVSLYRYGGASPGWVDIGTPQPLTLAFQPVQFIYGGTIPLGEFMNATRDVRARIRFYRATVSGPISPRFYLIDKVNWIYTSP